MNRTLLVVLVLAAGACAGAIKHTVPESELALLGGKGLEGVEAARAAEDEARRALEARRAEERAAEREVRIAEQAVRRDEADLNVARLRFEAVQETHDADAMLPANARRTQAEHAVASSKAELVYRRAALEHAGARIDEAEAAVDAAVARLEKAKLDAVLGDDPNLAEAQAKRRAAFEIQLAKAQAALAGEGARVAKAAGAMQGAESEWKSIAARKP